MARKSSRKRAADARGELPLLAVSVGVIFFTLQLLYLLLVADPTLGLTGLFTGLWLIGGLGFTIGVIAMIRESRWSLLLLAGPAFSFATFCLLAFLASFGDILTDVLAGG